MADYPIDFQLVADPVTFQRAPNAMVTVYDINDANNTTPLALKDLNGLPMANPMKSTAEAITPPFIAPVPDVKLFGGGYTIPASSAKGLRDAAAASATAAQTASASAGNAITAAQAAQAAAEAAAATSTGGGVAIDPSDPDALLISTRTDGTVTPDPADADALIITT